MHYRLFRFLLFPFCLLMLLSGCQKNLDTYDYDWENELVIVGNPIPSLIAAIEAHDQGMDDILVVVPFLKDQFYPFHNEWLPQSPEVLPPEYDRYAAWEATDQRNDPTLHHYELEEIMDFYTDYYTSRYHYKYSYISDSLFSTTVEHSGADVDWLRDRCGVPFASPVENLLPDYKLMMMPENENENGRPVLLSSLLQTVSELGIQIMNNASLTNIILDQDNTKVEGVEVTQFFTENKNDRSLSYSPKIKTQALIVAPDHFSKEDFDFHLSGNTSRLKLDNWEGAASLQEDYDYFTLPNIILINSDGRRFLNEKDPELKFHDLIFFISQQEPIYALSDLRHVEAAKISLNTYYACLDDLDSVALIINQDYPQVVKKTILEYNEYAKLGKDLEYDRAAETMSELVPPYTVIQYRTMDWNIFTTLTSAYWPIDEHGQVIYRYSPSNKIDGLYAIYGQYTAIPGWELTSELVWARIAAQSAANQ